MRKLLEFFSNVYYNIKLWFYLTAEAYKLKKVKKNLKVQSINIVQDQLQALYLEGINKVKRKINEKAKTKEEYEATLKEIDNLYDFAVKHDDEEYQYMINNLRSVYIYKHEDPKEVMIEKRIKAMYELQQDKLKRQKLREERNKAKQNE